jgi:hypothetical protein
MLAIIRGEMSNHSHEFARGWLSRDNITTGLSFDGAQGWCVDVECLRTEPHAPHHR